MGYLVFGHAVWHAGSYLSHQGLNLCPLHQEHGVLAIGPPGKSQRIHFISFSSLIAVAKTSKLS